MQVAEHGEGAFASGHQVPAPPPRHPEPAPVVRADLVPSAVVLVVTALTGLPLGWLWSRIAPPERVVVASDGSKVPLQSESFHRFDDLALFLLLGLAAGVVVGVAAWYLRARRGPVLAAAAVLGSALAGLVATKVGLVLAESHYAIAGVPKFRDVVALAPRLESSLGWLAQPLTTALCYGVLAAWNSSDDLGRGA